MIVTIDPSQPNTTSKLGDPPFFEGRFSMYQLVLKFVYNLGDTPTKLWLEGEVGICFEICFDRTKLNSSPLKRWLEDDPFLLDY